MAQLPRVGEVLGRYRIDDQIGFGGMGVVYGATDLDLGRRVAVKVLSAELGGTGEFLQRFQREAALLARLASPHVIGVYDYGEHDGNPYIVTQFVGGGDLGDLLHARGPMPPPLALDVCAQIADALADTHRLGVIHRDVKPSNVLLRDADVADLTAYLCDFGIARTSTDGLTAAGSVSGTWAYLAPEVAMGGAATPRSDIYALGCLLWAALTGRPPYAGSDVEIALAHQRSPIPQLTALLGPSPYLARLDEILRRCLAKRPEERYADADSVRTALLAAAADPAAPRMPLPASPVGSSAAGSRPPASVRPMRRGRRWTGALAAAVVVALVAAAVTLGITRPWASSASDADGGRSTTVTTPTTRSAAPSTSPTPVRNDGRPVDGDLNGDGLGDVIATRTAYGKGWTPADDVRVTWDSTGTSFKRVQTVSRNKLPSYDLMPADFDGDGRIEVAQIHAAKTKSKNKNVDREVVSARLTSGGTYRATVDTSYGKTEREILGVADVDGDGRDDLLTLTAPYDENNAAATGPATVYAAPTTKGHSPGKLRKITTVPVGWPTWGSLKFSIADVTGDRRADFVVSETATDMSRGDDTRLTIIPSARSGYGPPQTTTYHDYWADVATGDIDGDGTAEVVLVGSDGPVRVARYDHGRLGKPRVWGVLPNRSGDSGFAGLIDVNGDGRDDLVKGNWTQAGDTFVVDVALSSKHGELSQGKVWARWFNKVTDGAYIDLVTNVVLP